MTAEELAEKVRRKGLANLLETSVAFQDFVLRIVAETSIYGQTHVQGQPDTSAFREGRRAVGVAILNQLREANPRAVAILADLEVARAEVQNSLSQQETDDDASELVEP